MVLPHKQERLSQRLSQNRNQNVRMAVAEVAMIAVAATIAEILVGAIAAATTNPSRMEGRCLTGSPSSIGIISYKSILF